MLPLFFASNSAFAQVSDAPATVTFAASEPGLVISGIAGRATASGGGVTVNAVRTQDLCTAPCTIDLRPGFVELYGRGGGHVATVHRFELRPGPTTVNIEPGSAPLYWTGKGAQYLGLIGVGAFGGLAYIQAMDEQGSPGPYIGRAVGSGVLFLGGLTLSLTQNGKWRVGGP